MADLGTPNEPRLQRGPKSCLGSGQYSWAVGSTVGQWAVQLGSGQYSWAVGSTVGQWAVDDCHKRVHDAVCSCAVCS